MLWHSLSYLSDNNANVGASEISSFYKSMIESTISLNNDSNSTITYRVTVENLLNRTRSYDGVVYDSNFYDNSDITFDIVGLSVGDTIAPGEVKHLI